MTMTDITKAYVRENNTTTLTCPACGFIKHIDAEKLRLCKHMMTVRCRCQHVFKVSLEFRRHYRKQVCLTGSFEATSKNGIERGPITIHNISRGGLGFTVSDLHRIQKDQEVLLEFQLDDKKKTILKKRVTIKAVQQNGLIGCQFIDQADLDRDLGFFLRA